ncbi:helix-turn-helix domain-containing protein [Caldinitratiruptor microaerophilus]|uniref:helix-turn-helix domain-containing protein n=1 Tax=Caldinitratiruptor microaerophilus TaxID=671077 RepID=UPI00222E2E10|nr:helix-turn-helix domain-containing protein [Caldinitratiruptor microaerophilus]
MQAFESLRWVFQNSTLTTTEKVVLTCLILHADETGRCWPGSDTLATETGLSRRAVQYCLKQLEAKGLIAREAMPPKRTIYTVHLLQGASDAQCTGCTVQQLHGAPDAQCNSCTVQEVRRTVHQVRRTVHHVRRNGAPGASIAVTNEPGNQPPERDSGTGSDAELPIELPNELLNELPRESTHDARRRASSPKANTKHNRTVSEAERALVDQLWQHLKVSDALPADTDRFYWRLVKQARDLLSARSLAEWAACIEWALQDSYWRERLTDLRQLGEKVWPQFARRRNRETTPGRPKLLEPEEVSDDDIR